MKNKQALKIKTILLFFCLFLIHHTYTDAPFTWMKDSYAITNIGYKHLLPINGMVWSEQRIVENMYRYGNPHDGTIKLIKELFYLQADNVSFRPTILKSKPASYWTPKDIGKIMQVITAYRKKNMVSKKNENLSAEALAKEEDAQLTTALETIMQPQRATMQKIQKDMTERIANIQETVQDIAQQNKKLVALIRQEQRIKPTTPEEANEKITKLEQLEKNQKFLTGTRESLEEESHKLIYESKAIDRALQSGITQLIEHFIQSTKESTPHKTRTYIAYATEQILLTLLWKISNPRDSDVPKQDFVDYFKELTVINSANLQTWVNAKPYDKHDYEQFTEQFAIIKGYKLTEFMLNHYEHVILMVKGYHVWESPMPPIITGAQVTYIHPKGNQTQRFSDCVETAFRNFFNIILYNPITGTFDIQRLINSAPHDTNQLVLQPSKPLINFYQKNPSVTDLQASELYNAWTQVVENLPGVTYVEPSNFAQSDRFYNIQSSLPNMLKICNHLLFGNQPSFDQLSRDAQLDLICAQVSHDNFVLTWEIADEGGEKNIEKSTEKNILAHIDYVTLRFFINDTNSFEWQLSNGHSVIPQLDNAQYPNAKEIAKLLLFNIENKVPVPVEPYTLLAMFISDEMNNNANLIFLQALHESENKIDIITQLSAKATHGTPLQAILMQLIKSLAQDEFNENSARDTAQLMWNHLNNPVSPFYQASVDLFTTMKNQLVNSFLIGHIIKDKSNYWYNAAQQKFEAMTENLAVSHVIASILDNKFTRWYDLAQKKFNALTENEALAYSIQSVIYNERDTWYEIAQQKFNSITSDYALSEIIMIILTQKSKSWYAVAQEKFEAMTEEKIILVNNEDEEEEIYPLARVIDAVIENKVNEWEDVAKNKFKTMTNESALTEVITSILASKMYTWENIAREKFETMHNQKSLTTIINAVIYSVSKRMYLLDDMWYETALKKANEIGNNSLALKLQALSQSFKKETSAPKSS